MLEEQKSDNLKKYFTLPIYLTLFLAVFLTFMLSNQLQSNYNSSLIVTELITYSILFIIGLNNFYFRLFFSKLTGISISPLIRHLEFRERFGDENFLVYVSFHFFSGITFLFCMYLIHAFIIDIFPFRKINFYDFITFLAYFCTLIWFFFMEYIYCYSMDRKFYSIKFSSPKRLISVILFMIIVLVIFITSVKL